MRATIVGTRPTMRDGRKGTRLDCPVVPEKKAADSSGEEEEPKGMRDESEVEVDTNPRTLGYGRTSG